MPYLRASERISRTALLLARLKIGFFDTVNPALIYRVRNKNRGNQQSNLFSVSAGNDLRMSTMRPNPYLSTEIDKRRSKLRGFLQLITRAI